MGVLDLGSAMMLMGLLFAMADKNQELSMGHGFAFRKCQASRKYQGGTRP